MSNLNTYSPKGVKKDAISVPKSWQGNENLGLLAQAIRVYEDRSHAGLAKAKTRGEVNISTRKIYRQKGTGYARHGPRSAPIFVGGGVAHGPKGIKSKLGLSKKLRKLALEIAFNLKAKEGKVVVADKISEIKKSKDARGFLDSIVEKEFKGKKPSRFTIALSKENKAAEIAFRNLKETEVLLFKNMNAHSVFNGGVVVIDSKALEARVDGDNKSEGGMKAKNLSKEKSLPKNKAGKIQKRLDKRQSGTAKKRANVKKTSKNK